MRTFAIIFSAVLSAIVVAYFGLTTFQGMRTWHEQKSGALASLQRMQGSAAGEQRIIDGDDIEPIRGAKAALAVYRQGELDEENLLVTIYEQKPLPLTVDEKAQLAGWKKDLAARPSSTPAP